MIQTQYVVYKIPKQLKKQKEKLLRRLEIWNNTHVLCLICVPYVFQSIESLLFFMFIFMDFSKTTNTGILYNRWIHLLNSTNLMNLNDKNLSALFAQFVRQIMQWKTDEKIEGTYGLFSYAALHVVECMSSSLHGAEIKNMNLACV